MPGLAAEAVLALSLVLASERSLFHVPKPEAVRLQPITRTGNEKLWPFSVDSGHIACVWSAGQRVAFFIEETGEQKREARRVVLSVNPIELIFGNMNFRDLFRPAAGPEELIELVAPYVVMGRRLCDQPPGARIGHGEL